MWSGSTIDLLLTEALFVQECDQLLMESDKWQHTE